MPDALPIRLHRNPYPHGGTHQCARCGHERPFTADDVARYVAHGWPVCCGQTMTSYAAPAPTRRRGTP